MPFDPRNIIDKLPSGKRASKKRYPAYMQGYPQNDRINPVSVGGRNGGAPRRPRKKTRLTLAIEAWTARLLGAAKADGSFSEQEAEYESNRTSQDYLWNSIGMGAWGMVFPLLTIIVTQLVGVEKAGMFSLAFVAGNLLMFVANYGVRTYQVSDRDEEHSFIDYQVNRWLTCIIMLIIGYNFCRFRGYTDMMFTMSMWVFVYRAVDGLADCYEGRLQQVDKLYLAGISQTIRSVASLIIFSLVLLITRDLGIASIAMAIVAALSFGFITLPLTLLETPKSNRLSIASIGRLFAQCFPAFLALFMYNLVDNMPKFLMEGTLAYDNQLYFNAMYFPAMAILITVGFCYKPMLTRMADAWNDLSRRKRFDLLIAAALAAVAGITLVVMLLMATIGIPIMSVLYGIDFEQFRNFSYLMIVAGGITGGIDFLNQVFMVIRRQGAVIKLYFIAFAFSLAIPAMLIRVSGLRGAIIGYLIIMAILLVLLVLEYARIRFEYRRHPEDDPTFVAAQQRAAVDEIKSESRKAASAAKARREAAVAVEEDVRQVPEAYAKGTAQPMTSRRAEVVVQEPSARERATRRTPEAYVQQPRQSSRATTGQRDEAAASSIGAAGEERQQLAFSPREIARQERIIREGGEPDPRYRAWRALQRRRQNSGNNGKDA